MKNAANIDVVILTMEGYRAAHFGNRDLAESYFAAAEAACAMTGAPPEKASNLERRSSRQPVVAFALAAR